MSSEQDTISWSDDNLSYKSGSGSRSPHTKQDRMDKMAETINALIKQLAAKDAEIQRLTTQIVEKRALSEARHQEMLTLITELNAKISLGRGTATKPSEALAPIAETTPQPVHEMEVDDGPSGLKREAPDDDSSPTEEGRPPKGKRLATEKERRSFAHASAAAGGEKTTRVTETPPNAAKRPANTGEEDKQQKIPPIILHNRESLGQTSQGINVHPTTVNDFHQIKKFVDE